MKRLRLQRGLTQQALAELADLEYKYLQKIESGRWPGLQLRTVERLASALKVDAWELLCPTKGGLARPTPLQTKKRKARPEKGPP